MVDIHSNYGCVGQKPNNESLAPEFCIGNLNEWSISDHDPYEIWGRATGPGFLTLILNSGSNRVPQGTIGLHPACSAWRECYSCFSRGPAGSNPSDMQINVFLARVWNLSPDIVFGAGQNTCYSNCLLNMIFKCMHLVTQTLWPDAEADSCETVVFFVN